VNSFSDVQEDTGGHGEEHMDFRNVHLIVKGLQLSYERLIRSFHADVPL
jgi:hypothetical protein